MSKARYICILSIILQPQAVGCPGRTVIPYKEYLCGSTYHNNFAKEQPDCLQQVAVV